MFSLLLYFPRCNLLITPGVLSLLRKKAEKAGFCEIKMHSTVSE